MYRRYISRWFHENAFSSRKLFHRSVQGDSHPIFRVRFEGLSGDKLSLDFPCLVAQVMRVPPRFRVDPNLPSKGHTTLFPQGWRIYGRGGVRPRGRKMRRHCLRWKFCAMGVVRHGSPRVFTTTIGSEISRREWGAGIWQKCAPHVPWCPFQNVRNRRKFFAPRFANLPAGMRVEKVYSPFFSIQGCRL